MKIFSAFMLMLAGFTSYAQKLPEIGTTIRLTEPDRTVVAEVRPTAADIKTKADHHYFWYGGGKIQQTQGGYSGKLLNGAYNEYYPNKNLKTQGRFEQGSRTGVWKNWTEGGVLISLVSYKEGRRAGVFSEYDLNGKLIRRGGYQQDQLQGKLYTYQQDSVTVTIYKNGKEIPPGTEKPFWKKIRLFGKKGSRDSSSVKTKP